MHGCRLRGDIPSLRSERFPPDMLAIILLLTLALTAIAYRFYGAFLERQLEMNDSTPTPAVTLNDGIDYVPTRASVVFGHHFSSIAGAGPIVGPIVAAAAFGWGPAWLWILVGSIFVGGVHDFGSTMMSLRYGGKSIISACRDLVGERTGKLLLVFVFMTLIYVIIVFLDLTAAGFVSTPEVATASGWFVLMALAFGRVIVGTRMPYWAAISVFVALTYAGLAVGHYFPAPELGKDAWILAVLAYCFAAAILPVNVLMQPRDFLSATFLYAIMALGLVGALVKHENFELPFYAGFQSENLGMMVPFLFITVACGACSGFHSMVGSGTTSKQIRRESDVRRVAYGGMLVEGVLATFALGCIAVIGGMKGSAVDTFAAGAAVFFSALGVPQHIGVVFATLAVSTFLLTTLDTCTRLARFLVEEMFGWTGVVSRVVATLAIVGFCGVLATQKFTSLSGELVPAWKALWPLFGATNQLLAALALVTLTVFLRSRRVAIWFAALPAALMIAMPMAAMVTIALDSRMELLLRVASAAQLALGLFVIGMSVRFLVRPLEPARA